MEAIRFRDLFQTGIAALQEAAHVALQKQSVGQNAYRAERRCPLQSVSHQDAVLRGKKFVGVVHHFERAPLHCIDKAIWPVIFHDLRRQPLPDAEVIGLERYGVSPFQEPAGAARRHGSLARPCRRLAVNTDIPRQIKTGFRGHRE